MASPSFTQEEIIKAITLLAFRAGDFRTASKELRANGIEVTPERLKKWAEGEYAEDYKRIRDRYKHELEEEAVREMRAHVALAAKAERLAIEKAVERLEQGKSVSPAQDALSMARVKKENIDKLLALTGRPQQIIEDRSAEQVVKSLIAKKILRPVRESDDD